jgi:hypothetical protein
VSLRRGTKAARRGKMKDFLVVACLFLFVFTACKGRQKINEENKRAEIERASRDCLPRTKQERACEEEEILGAQIR